MRQNEEAKEEAREPDEMSECPNASTTIILPSDDLNDKQKEERTKSTPK
jgi:hypothetical protein